MFMLCLSMCHIATRAVYLWHLNRHNLDNNLGAPPMTLVFYMSLFVNIFQKTITISMDVGWIIVAGVMATTATTTTIAMGAIYNSMSHST